MSAKSVDRSGAGQRLTAVGRAARNEILLPGIYGYPLSIDDQGITPLDDDHVFIEIVGVR